MTDDFSDRFTFERDGKPYLKLVYDLSVYFEGPPQQHAAGLVAFYEGAMALLGEGVRFYRTGTMRRSKPVDADTRTLFPTWMARPARRADFFMLWLESGATAGEPSDRAFQFLFDAEGGVGEIRLMLPPTTPAERGGPALVGLVRDLVGGLAFSSGLSGYGLHWHYLDGDRAARAALRATSQRYLGVDLPSCGSTEYIVPKGIKGAGWLTLLSHAWCARVGGAERLAAAVAPDVLVHALPGGVIVQAGPVPALGDKNRDEVLPAYRTVGRALSKLRARGHPALIHNDAGFEEDDLSEAWLARFDR